MPRESKKSEADNSVDITDQFPAGKVQALAHMAVRKGEEPKQYNQYTSCAVFLRYDADSGKVTIQVLE